MGLFPKIFSDDHEETSGDVERLMTDLDKEEAQERQTIQTLQARRDALLLAGDDKQLLADKRAIEKAELAIERCQLARVKLSERRIAAKDRERNRTIAELIAERSEIIREVRRDFLAAVVANEKAMAFHDKCVAKVGPGAELLFQPIAFPLLRREMLTPWEAYIEQMAGPKPVKQKSRAVSSVVSDVVEVVSKAVVPVKKKKPKEGLVQSLSGVVPQGMSRVVIFRDGYEGPGGKIYRAGEEIDLPSDIAMAVVRNGSGDFVATGVANFSDARPQDGEVLLPQPMKLSDDAVVQEESK